MSNLIELLKKCKNGKKLQYLEVANNSINIYKDQDCKIIKQQLKLNFDISIEWLYLGKIDKSTKILPPLIGFILVDDIKQKVWTYYSSNEQKLQELHLNLTKNIKQQKIQYYYEVIKKIGEGNFAFVISVFKYLFKVYLVQNRWTKQLFAAKVFNKEKYYKDAQGKQSVQNEITILSQVNHPNIVKFHQVFETEHSIYLLMEHIAGISLLEAIQQKPYLFTESKISQLFQQIFSLLDYLHKNHLMHRDIKPENLIFHKQKAFSKLKLIDFGLAEYDTNEQFLFPRCGTPGFVAPEIISNKQMLSNYNCSCDLFSSGCILHLLLFKKLLFKTSSLTELINANKQCNINFEDKMYESISIEGKILLQGILAKDKDQRWNAETALNSDFILQHSKKQQEINIQSLQQIDSQQGQQQQFQDNSTSGKINISKDQSSYNNADLILQHLIACEKTLDSSQKLKEQEKNKKDSNNSISKHDEISYSKEYNQAKKQQQKDVIQFSSENMSIKQGYPSQIQKKKPLLKKSMFKFGTVDEETASKKQEEEKVQINQLNF